MNIVEIKDKNTIIAKIIRNGKWPEGLTFHTEDKDFIQVATWKYNAGKHLTAHGHKICKRSADRTQEMVFVKKGKMKISIYNNGNKLIKEEYLKEGDAAILYTGGHAYDILKDGTQILEVKNGPYPGIEKDKESIEE